MNANEVKEKWLNIQKRSYTNWINEVLRPTGVVVNDIVDDIGSGVLLCKLAMLLTMKKIKYQRNPKMVFQRQENIQKALILIEQSGCKLIGIGASDILTKNEKLILGLMWQLIQHFHVFQSIKNVEKMKQQLKSEQLMGNARDGETDEIYDNDLKSSDKQKKSSAIKRQILADLNKRLAKRGVEVDNLTKDWKDGEALCALVDYNVRGIYDLYLDSDPVQKVAQSMIAAYKFLGIPQLIEPEDFISNLIDEQTMSMYLSCFVHDGIEEISVDLFEGIKKEEEKVQTVEEIVKKNHVLVKQESVLSMPITPASAVVLDFIQDLQEEEEKASPGRFKAANQHVTKIISSLPDHSPSRQSSLSEILAPQVRSNSDSSVDEGIGPDILADVSASLQSTPSKGDPDPEKNISSEDVIAKVSLEDSLPASEPVETVSTEPADVADVIEQEIQAVNVTPEVIPVESSALSISDPECSSPGEIELVSEDNQEDIRQKLENEIAASISAEMSSIRNKDDSERLDSSEEKGDETSLSDVENRTGGWGQEGAIITTSLEQVISQEEPEVTDRDLSTPEPLDDEEGETPTIESEKSILEVDLKAIEPSADPVDLTIETEEPIVSEITDEVKVTSEIEVKEPVVNVEATVEVPKIELNTSEEVEDTSTEIAATALEVAASGTLAEAALEAASTPTVDVDVKTSAPEFDIHTDEEPEVPAEVPDLETPEVAISTEVAAPEVPEGAISTEAVAPDVPEVTISTEVVAPEVPEVDIPTEAVAPEVPEVAISTEVAAPEVPEVNISTELVAPEVPEVTIPTEVEAPEVPEVTISTEVAAPEVPEVAISTEVVAPDVPEVDISTEVVAPDVPEVAIPTEVVASEVPEVAIPTEVVASEVPEVSIPTEVAAPEVPEVAISTDAVAPEVPEVDISTEVVAPEVPDVTVPAEVETPEVDEVAILTEVGEPDAESPDSMADLSLGVAASGVVSAALNNVLSESMETPEITSKRELNTSEEVENASAEIAVTALEVAASGALAEAALEAASTPTVDVEVKTTAPEFDIHTDKEPEVPTEDLQAAISTEVVAPEVPKVAILAEVAAPEVPEVGISTEVVPPDVPGMAISAEVAAPEVPEVNISTEVAAPEVPEVTIPTEVVSPDVPEVDISTEIAAPDVPEVAISTEVLAPDVPEVDISAEVVAPDVPEVTIPREVVPPVVPEVDISTEVVAPEVPEANISAEILAPDVPEVAISTEVAAPDVPKVDISPKVAAQEVPEVAISAEVVAPDVPEVAISTEVVTPEVPEVAISAEVVAPDVPEVNISTDVVAPDVPEVAISTEVAAPEVPEVAISTEVVAPDVPEVDISTEVVAPDVPAAAAISITTDLEVDVPEVETQVSAGLSEPDTVAAVIELPTLTSGFDESSDVEISAGTEPSSDIEVTIPKDDNVAKVSEPEISTKIATESQGVDVDIPMAVISTKVETETVEVGIPASDISKEDTDVDEKVKTPKVEGAADITVSGGDTENEIESLPSIDASFIRDIEFNSDGEMIVPSSTDEPISIEKPIATVEPTLTDEPIYSVSTKQKIPPLVDSEVSVPEKRISVAASSGSSTTKSTKSLRGSIISGGDEISVSKIDKQFPAIDSRLLLLLASMDTTSQEYEAAKEQFRKFIAKSDIDYRSVSFLKCCQLMRASLLAAQFKIVGAGENVMFDDLPFKPKRGFTTLTLKKKKSSKKLEDIDPLLAQLPKSASLKKSHTADQPLSKKQMQRQKELGNASISLYTEVVQCYQNYKTMMQTAQSWQGSQLEASYGDCMDTMQDEVMMGNMILTGLCSPD
ncbi:hypothetical protein ACHWQZ_G015441 [Mnemiopsis leidyi]